MSLPSDARKVRFRPYTVKEEKLLLMAQQGNEPAEIVAAVKQLVSNCLIDDLKIEDIPAFDLEYLFIKLRAKSVNNTVTLSYKDNEDGKIRDFSVDLEKIDVKRDPNHSRVIPVTPEISIEMNYPTIGMSDALKADTETEAFINIIKVCLNKVIALDENNKATEYPAKDSTPEEIEDFVLSIPIPVLLEIQEFFDTAPRVTHEIDYVNDKGNARKIILSSLTDFFSLS